MKLLCLLGIAALPVFGHVDDTSTKIVPQYFRFKSYHNLEINLPEKVES